MTIDIRARIILLALISALPLIVMDVHQAREVERGAIKRAQQETLLLARGFAAMQEDVFDDTRNLLSGFSAGLEGQQRALTGKGCDAGMQRLLQANPLHINIVLADLSGALVCSARPLAGPVNIADRQYFRDAVLQKTVALSDVIVSRDSGLPVL